MNYLTYQDIVEHLVAASFGGPQDAEQKDIRTAVQRAYRELTFIRDWRYYHTHSRIIFNQPWNGSITYDPDTRIITKESGDAFPLYAAGCSLRCVDTVARVVERLSNTELRADPVLGFSDAILGATPATLYQALYTLPADFRNMDTPIDQYKWSYFIYVTPDEAMKIETATDLQGPPHAWTVIKDPYGPGYAVKVIGYPTEITNLDFTYRRAPRLLRRSGHEAASRQGTITAAGTTVTGVGTAFDASMVGSILRFGTAASVPDTLGSLNPYTSESIITAVASPTQLTVEDAFTATAVKYVVTDYADIPASMHNALLSAAEYWLSRMRGQKPDNAFAMYQRDLRMCMEQDDPVPLSGAPRMIYNLQGWQTELQSDNSGPNGNLDGGAP